MNSEINTQHYEFEPSNEPLPLEQASHVLVSIAELVENALAAGESIPSLDLNEIKILRERDPNSGTETLKIELNPQPDLPVPTNREAAAQALAFLAFQLITGKSYETSEYPYQLDLFAVTGLSSEQTAQLKEALPGISEVVISMIDEMRKYTGNSINQKPLLTLAQEISLATEFIGAKPIKVNSYSDPSSESQYWIKKEVWRGGYGDVYQAFDPLTRKKVALKHNRQLESHPPELMDQALLLESQTQDKVGHRLTRPFQVVVAHGLPYSIKPTVTLVMPWLDSDIANPDKDFSTLKIRPEDLTWILPQIAEQLDSAAAQGVFHNDFCPNNLTINLAQHKAVVTDWGGANTVSKKTGIYPINGLTNPPEQLATEPAQTLQVQVYAVAATVYQLLTGFPLSESLAESKSRKGMLADVDVEILTEALGNGEIAERLTGVLNRGLAYQPQDRYPSVGQLADAVLAAIS